MTETRRQAHHVDFSAQLEAMGLWHWSIFVLLHLEDPVQRTKMAKEVLGRNVIPSDDESAEREVFLQDRLGVPLAWIAEAKSVRACIESNYGDQVIDQDLFCITS
jgi:nuclear pore complex protein Nup98-Nup96